MNGKRNDPPSDDQLHESTDGRGPWAPQSRYEERYRSQQRTEAWYTFVLLIVALALLGYAQLGCLAWLATVFNCEQNTLRSLLLLSGGGLLGGTVYGAKWLYHAIAIGIWHEDRKTWRYLSPWISLGTTIGVGALIDAGFFRNIPEIHPTGASTLVGGGFLIGYFADKFLAKMKDVTEVLFGETQSRFEKSQKQQRKRQK